MERIDTFLHPVVYKIQLCTATNIYIKGEDRYVSLFPNARLS